MSICVGCGCICVTLSRVVAYVTLVSWHTSHSVCVGWGMAPLEEAEDVVWESGDGTVHMWGVCACVSRCCVMTYVTHVSWHMSHFCVFVGGGGTCGRHDLANLLFRGKAHQKMLTFPYVDRVLQCVAVCCSLLQSKSMPLGYSSSFVARKWIDRSTKYTPSFCFRWQRSKNGSRSIHRMHSVSHVLWICVCTMFRGCGNVPIELKFKFMASKSWQLVTNFSCSVPVEFCLKD